MLKLLFNDDERPFLVYPNHFPFRRAFACLDEVALRLFSTSFFSVFDIWENNASEKSLFFYRKETWSFSGAITLIPQDKHSVCICSEQLFLKTVNSAGGIKEMGWDEVELSPLALPQGNEHSLAHAVIGTTQARKACAQIQESP